MYEVVYHTISSLNEVDYDTLFNDSLIKLEPSFSFPSHYTLEQKKDMFRVNIQNMIDGTSALQKTDEVLLMQKVTVDGIDASLTVGYIEADPSIFRNHWFLVSPINNSRSWLYSDEYRQALTEYYNSKGITSFRGNMKSNTPIYDHVMNKRAANNYTIDDQTIVSMPPTAGAITCIINF